MDEVAELEDSCASLFYKLEKITTKLISFWNKHGYPCWIVT